jgi:radical SAM superfamily enzyme YgiQ (UPF0313 family)
MDEHFSIPYEGTVIRPPSEADSLIFQITLGCSDNRCIFCPAYKDKPFRVKTVEEVDAELQAAADAFPLTRKLFFADGDAIAMEQSQLLRIFKLANTRFPYLSRISLYGSVKSLQQKTVADLRGLKEQKLGIIYLGFETGDEEVYALIRKYGSPLQNVEACMKVKDAGIKTNVSVILGLGGKMFSRQHAVNTAKILNLAQPHQIAALTLMVAPSTPLYDLVRRGEFRELATFEYLDELKLLLENMEDFRCLFFANHASNYLPVSARFPKDRLAVIAELDAVLRHRNADILIPDHLRGL